MLQRDSYDKSKNKIIKKYISLLKDLNIIYFLGFGSELGALRNGGFIRNDHDVDIMIPVWLNYNIFHCREHIEYYSNKCYIYSNINSKICNKTKHDFMIILNKYIEDKLKKKIYYYCKLWGIYGYTSCWTMQMNNIFLDLWILIGNEYYYQNIEICLCHFSDCLTYCTSNPIVSVAKMYGKYWTKPIKKGCGARACKVILVPTKNNSVLRKE